MQYKPRPAALAAAALVIAAAPLVAGANPALAPQQWAVRQGTANVGGLWCGAGLLREFTLEIAQHYQDVQGKLVRKARVREITGHVHGAVVKTDPQRDHTMELLAQGDELRIVGATGMLALAKGQFFTRATGGSCRH
jgi:hypothetical protein